jgi:hypothetical protein
VMPCFMLVVVHQLVIMCSCLFALMFPVLFALKFPQPYKIVYSMNSEKLAPEQLINCFNEGERRSKRGNFWAI